MSLAENAQDKLQSPQINFIESIRGSWRQKRFVCVGLDSDPHRIPEAVGRRSRSPGWKMYLFNSQIVDATGDLACAFKINPAFYLPSRSDGMDCLVHTAEYIKSKYPHLPIILDGKWSDVRSSLDEYTELVDALRIDAATFDPYFGLATLASFIEKTNKGVIVYCTTSNPEAGTLQDLKVKYPGRLWPIPLYQAVVLEALKLDKNGNLCLGVAATYPEK